MKYIKKLVFIFFLFGFEISSWAQATVAAAGNNATGSAGTASFSVGQVAYLNIQGTNGSVVQGVQHAYELYTVSTNPISDIILSMTVFPNPVGEVIQLIVENENLENLYYQLYDLRGKLILDHKIDNRETSISMENMANSTYFLKVNNNNNELKTFKIIKNK